MWQSIVNYVASLPRRLNPRYDDLAVCDEIIEGLEYSVAALRKDLTSTFNEGEMYMNLISCILSVNGGDITLPREVMEGIYKGGFAPLISEADDGGIRIELVPTNDNDEEASVE